MKRIITHLLILTAFILTGCEGAKAPLGVAGEVALDDRLFGTWVGSEEGEAEDLSILTISPHGDSEYTLVYKDVDEKESEEIQLRAFATSINGILFANLTCLNCEDEEEVEDEEEWFFFSFNLESDDVLVATALEDAVYKKGLKDLSSTAEIRAYVEAHLSDDSFFEDESGRFQRSNK